MTMGRASIFCRLSCAVRLALVAAAVSVSAVMDVTAEPIADFYRGKTIRMIIGYGPGGGYDLYGRLVAEFLPRHIPGNPTILPQNMPGAGSFVAAKYLAEVAPKDGTAPGSLAQTLALDSTVNSSSKLDAAKFRYLGRLTSNIDVARRGSAPASSRSRIRRRDIHRSLRRRLDHGADPVALNAHAGAKLKIVRGTRGPPNLLAMERGEVDRSAPMGFPACWSVIRAGSTRARRRSSIRPRSAPPAPGGRADLRRSRARGRSPRYPARRRRHLEIGTDRRDVGPPGSAAGGAAPGVPGDARVTPTSGGLRNAT